MNFLNFFNAAAFESNQNEREKVKKNLDFINLHQNILYFSFPGLYQ